MMGDFPRHTYHCCFHLCRDRHTHPLLGSFTSRSSSFTILELIDSRIVPYIPSPLLLPLSVSSGDTDHHHYSGQLSRVCSTTAASTVKDSLTVTTAASHRVPTLCSQGTYIAYHCSFHRVGRVSVGPAGTPRRFTTASPLGEDNAKMSIYFFKTDPTS